MNVIPTWEEIRRGDTTDIYFRRTMEVLRDLGTAVEAEARAKAALLSGLAKAARWLPHGGLAVDLEGRVHRLASPAASL